MVASVRRQRLVMLSVVRHRVGPGIFFADIELIAARDGVSVGSDGARVIVIVPAIDAIITFNYACDGEGAIAA